MVKEIPPIACQGLRPTKVAAKLDIGLSSVWHRAKNDPTFPKPRKLSPRVTVFLEHEVDAYILASETLIDKKSDAGGVIDTSPASENVAGTTKVAE